MPKPLSTRKRNAIVTDIRGARESGTSVRKIATAHGVAPSTVTRIAKDHGLADAFGRSQTAKATRAKQVDNKAKRAQLASDLLDDTQRIRARIWGSHKVVISTPLGAEVVELDENPLAEIRSGMTALGIAADKSIKLEQHDGVNEGGAEARSMLGRLFAGLSEAAAEYEGPREDG